MLINLKLMKNYVINDEKNKTINNNKNRWKHTKLTMLELFFPKLFLV